MKELIDKSKQGQRPYIVLALVGLGLAIGIWQPVSLADLLDWGRAASDMPLVIALVLAAMVLLFAFGLPGSLGIWLIAPFHPPIVSTALLLLASVTGALGGYAISKRLSGDWQPEGVSKKVFELLEKRSDFLTQTALRALPGFPHSVINFAGGVLLLPLAVFTAAALVGLAAKWGVYSMALYGLTDAIETGSPIQATTLAPLIVLSVLMLLGTWARARIVARNGLSK